MLSWNILNWIIHHVKNSHNQKISNVPISLWQQQTKVICQFFKQGNRIQFVTDISKRNITLCSVHYLLLFVSSNSMQWKSCTESIHFQCNEWHVKSTSVGKVILVHILRHIPIRNINNWEVFKMGIWVLDFPNYTCSRNWKYATLKHYYLLSKVF
jgi:hypothetical protein